MMKNNCFSDNDLRSATNGEWRNLSTSIVVNGISTDSRKDSTGQLFLPIRGEIFDGHQFINQAIENNASAICVDYQFLETQKLPHNLPVLVVEDTTEAYQHIARFHRRRLTALTVIALTGSCGKTTTKEFLKSILSYHYGDDVVYATKDNTNNHIGVPFNLLNVTEQHRFCILEMGTNHFGEIEVLSRTAEPDIAIITNIGACHLEHFKSLAGVAKEKSTIFSYLNPKGVAIIPDETPGFDIIQQKIAEFNTLIFGEGEMADLNVRYLKTDFECSESILTNRKTGEQEILRWNKTGRHQAINAAAAATISIPLDIPLEHVVKGLQKCNVPGMRMQRFEYKGNIWINDAYNANPTSMYATLEWLKEAIDETDKLTLVLGDMLELGDIALEEHDALITYVKEHFPTATCYFVGELMYSCAEERQYGVRYKCVGDIQHPIVRESEQKQIVFIKGSRGVHLERLLPTE